MMRIGPRMRQVERYVRAYGPCAMLPVAAYVGPNSLTSGYRTVHRAIDAGIIHPTYSRGRYTLTHPDVCPGTCRKEHE